METHYFGTLGVIRAFAPMIEAQRRRRDPQRAVGAVLDAPAEHGAYTAGKAAAWAMTNAVRKELAPHGHRRSSALHVGYMDTDMADYVAPADKIDPVAVAAAALDGIEAGATEVIGDEKTRLVKQGLSGAAG